MVICPPAIESRPKTWQTFVREGGGRRFRD
jgi:hypothetical protein